MAKPDGTEELESTRMSLGEHLIELRKRLFRGVLAVVIAFIAGWTFYEPIGKVLLEPLNRITADVDASQVEKYEAELLAHPELPRSTYFRTDHPEDKRLQPDLTIDRRPIQRSLSDGFLFSMKVALAFAFAVGGPILIYQMWQFIAAGLYPKERRLVLSYFPFSVALFLAGITFGGIWLVPFCMKFMARAFPPETMGAMYGISEYWEFYATMTLALGAIFQLPVVMFALVHVDLVTRKAFARYRAHFVLFAFVFGGIITPPDPGSQFAVAVPMVLLYELGLLATLPMTRRRERERRLRDGLPA